ncbi:MAG: Ig-like domain-containing protein [Peptococcaceae bacterium]|nr:Ig-like domain-containing protein [Peptococcaceae bacterium]
MKRFVPVLALAVTLFAFVLPAFASLNPMTDQGAYQFGYTQKGQRLYNAGHNQMGLAPAWYANTGLSYSQPDILDGSALGTPNGYPAVIVAAGNTLYGFDTMLPDANDPGSFQQNQPLWSVPLAGQVPTKSHPTVADINGRYVVFIGSAGTGGGAVLQAFDVTGTFSEPGQQPTKVFQAPDPNATDIVSAPVIMQWNGHLIALYTTGDNGNIDIVHGFSDYGKPGWNPSNVHVAYIHLGGRTSSTIAPVLGGTAFLAGDDYSASTPYVNGPGVYLYKLNDVLGLDGSGHVVVKSQHYYWYFADPHAGQGSSFSVSGDGTQAYFIDDAGYASAIDLNNLAYLWHNFALAGTQNWRSPALDAQNVYFPSGCQSGTQGYLLAVNRTTGQTVWKAALPDGAAGTAPGVWEGPDGNEVMIGSGNYIDIYDASTGDFPGHLALGGNVANGTGTWYGAGVSGEFAVADEEAVVAASNGVAAWVNDPYDFAVTKVDPGTPKDAHGDYVAQGGRKYTATVTVSALSGPTPVSEVSVAGLHNIGGIWDARKEQATGGTWYSAVLSSNGTALPKGSMQSINSGEQADDYYVGLTPGGQTEQFQFQWTAPMTSETDVIGGAVDLDFSTSNNPLVQDWPDIYPANNLLEVPVKVEEPELVVTPDTILQAGQTQQMTATYYSEGQGNSPGQVVTTAAVWSSSNGSIVGINQTGLATAESQGSDTITAGYNGATGTAHITVYSSPAVSPSWLTFQATSQYGDIQRTPNTAKWTDSVTATLVPPVRVRTYSGEGPPPAGTVAPPQPPSGDDPGPPNNDYQDYSYAGAVATIDRWWITDGTLIYPQQNPDYSFDHPLPPAGNVTINMSVGSKHDGTPAATAAFKEMWAEDGTPVYDVIAGQPVGPPRNYTLTADYDWGLLYSDTYYWLDRRGGDIVPEAGINDPLGFQGNGKLIGLLLVDGTGTAATGL